MIQAVARIEMLGSVTMWSRTMIWFAGEFWSFSERANRYHLGERQALIIGQTMCEWAANLMPFAGVYIGGVE